jgi:hypothetical protein
MTQWRGIHIDVRFGSKADICGAKSDVRFTPEADMCGALAYVCFGPTADISPFTRSPHPRARLVGSEY